MTIAKQGVRRMASFRYFLASVALISALLVSPALADWESKPFTWGPWDLYLEMKDAAGLGLRNVSYQGNQILGKADLPVIRVKYVREWPAWHPFSWLAWGDPVADADHSRTGSALRASKKTLTAMGKSSVRSSIPSKASSGWN